MHKTKNDFEIPIDIKQDLIYCQRALTTYILLHQKIAVAMSKTPGGRLQRSLRSIEKEIIDIGDEQKSLFNRLRFYIDYHQLTTNAKMTEREQITSYVRDELQNFARLAKGSDIKPTNVQHRLNEDALYRKYSCVNDAMDDETSNSHGHSSRNSVSDELKTDSLSEPMSSVSASDDEKMEILVQPDDVQCIQQMVYSGPRQKVSKLTPTPSPPPPAPSSTRLMPQKNRSNESLLKPIQQRIIEENDANGICVVRPEIGITRRVEKPKPPPSPQPQPPQQTKQPQTLLQPPQQRQPDSISLFRMRLSAALCKAKDEQTMQLNRIQTESPETVSPRHAPVTQTLTVKCNTTPLSSSPSSVGGSPSSSADAEQPPPHTDVDISEMDQENFLRLFDLCTPAHTAYLLNRPPQRKRRTCTSTERMDFHYGKFELFEKQFSKRSKRQFLYSPPATRAKRRIGSNGGNSMVKEVLTTATAKRTKGTKSNASSSSSISSNGSNQLEKVCLTCFKRNNLLQCQKCCGQYHAACHSLTIDVQTRKTFCSICIKQKLSNSKQMN